MDPQQLLQIANVLAECGATREQIVEAVKAASGPNPQRELNEEERNIFAGAIGRAVDIMPAFRDAISLIRPFKDHTTDTLYTDRYSRVGIGPMFFLPTVSPHRRATLLLHEAMHILNNHFSRHVDFHIDPSSDNSAKDLEINSLLQRHPKADLSMLLLPSQKPFEFPEVKSYEQYARLMKDKGLIPQEMPSSGNSESQEPPAGSESSDDTAQKDQPSETETESNENPGDGSEIEDSEDSDGEGSGDGESEEKSDPSGEGESQDGAGEGESGDSTDGEDSESEGDSEGEGSEGSQQSGSGGGSSEDSDPESIADSALEDSEESSSSTGTGAPGTSCDRTSSEREQIADDLEIERASSSEQSVARDNTVARIREEAAKSKARGDAGALLMLQKMELAMAPSKVDWRVIFRNIMSHCRDAIALGRTDHTYRRVNRRLSSGEFIFPGMIRYEPSTIMAIDTSGSMSEEDYAFLLSELETIVRSVMRTKDRFKAFCVDGKATEPKVVRAIKDLDLRGGGGTRMEVAIQSIELLPRKEIPDIFILATDGGTSWPAFKKELLKSKHSYKTVVLITQEGSYQVAKTTLAGLADVVDISQKGTGTLGY